MSNLRCIGGPPDEFTETPVELGSFTLLLGPNGAGKSTLLDALDILARTASGDERLLSVFDRLGGFDDLVYRQDRGRKIGFRLDVPELGIYLCELGWSRDGASAVSDKLIGHRRGVLLERRGRRTWVRDDRESEPQDFAFPPDVPALAALPEDEERYPEAVKFRRFLRQMLLLRLKADACRLPGNKPAVTIGADGSGLSELAMHLFQREKRAWSDVSGFVSEAVPSIESIQPYMGSDSKLTIQAKVKGLPRPVPAQLLSDGTMLVLAIACVCFDPSPPSVIMIEEPDHGVHARMQELIMQALRAAARRTTVLVTTHATGMLSQVRGLDDVLLAEATPTGTRFVRPGAREHLKKWIRTHGMASAYEAGLLGGIP